MKTDPLTWEEGAVRGNQLVLILLMTVLAWEGVMTSLAVSHLMQKSLLVAMAHRRQAVMAQEGEKWAQRP